MSLEDVTQYLVTAYQDPLFFDFPLFTVFLGITTFLLLATPWTVLAWFDPEWAKPYKTQNKAFNVQDYLGKNLFLICKNTTILLLFLVLSWPIIRLAGIHNGEIPHWSTFVWQLAFFMFLDDFLYYWLHRTMHENKWLLKHVHSVHHHVRNPSAIAGNYFHWAELSLTAGLAMIGPILLESHLYVVYAWYIWRQVEAVDGHTGYDFPWNPMRFVPFYHGPAFHDAHHETFKGNYAGFLPVVDRWFKTQSPLTQKQKIASAKLS